MEPGGFLFEASGKRRSQGKPVVRRNQTQVSSRTFIGDWHKSRFIDIDSFQQSRIRRYWSNRWADGLRSNQFDQYQPVTRFNHFEDVADAIRAEFEAYWKRVTPGDRDRVEFLVGDGRQPEIFLHSSDWYLPVPPWHHARVAAGPPDNGDRLKAPTITLIALAPVVTSSWPDTGPNASDPDRMPVHRV